ncbi:MAG: GDP-L-fucose synthase [Candidatus Omnitrophota bacterium]
MPFWENKRILVTGGAGFVGQVLSEKIRQKGGHDIFAPLREEYDLREKDQIIQLYKKVQPDIVIHLAAEVGGIGANLKRPGEFFYNNLIMGAQLMEYARIYNVRKFVAIGTVCAYPKLAKIPFRESQLWDGYPEETNAPYGLAKKMLLVQAQAYRRQYGFNAIYLLPVNMYGPGDNFDLENSHVIPAIIVKCFDALKNNADKIVLWGSGKATREFLYVGDCAEAICLAAEKYDQPDPVNIGAGFEISIKDLAKMIAQLVGFKGAISWDKTKPDGQPRRKLDVSLAKKEFGFQAQTKLEQGLKITIDWYRGKIFK